MGFNVAVVYYSLYGRLVTLANVVAEGARSVAGARVTVYRVHDPIRGDDPAAFDEGVLDAPVVDARALERADVIVLGAPARQGGLCGEMRLFLDSIGPMQAGVRPTSATPGGGGLGAGGWVPARAPTPPPPARAAAPGDAAAAAEAAAGGLPADSRPPTPPMPPPALTGPLLKGKVGAAFTSVGGPIRGPGGAEMVLASMHATLLAHGMVVVGAPPGPALAACPGATPLGAVAVEACAASVSTGFDTGQAALAATAAAAAAAANGPRSGAKAPPLTEAEVRIAFATGQWAAQVGRLLHDAELDADGGLGEGEGREEVEAGLCIDGYGL